MNDKALYGQILNLHAPWKVTDVELDRKTETVTVQVRLTKEAIPTCPTCNKPSPGYDTRTKRWRHLDTCQYKTILEAEIPRVQCKTHGVLLTQVPWAEPGSGFTALFEALIIDWLQEASVKAVSKQFRLSWNSVDVVMQRAVKRGLAKRRLNKLENIHVDETAYQKRHEYVSVVSEKGRVLYVADGRKESSLEPFFSGLSEQQANEIRSISMDMWPAFIKVVKRHIPQALEKICFDKFHVAQYLGKAVDQVRKQEHKTLMQSDCDLLKGTKYKWLRNPENMKASEWSRFKGLLRSAEKTSRAWAIKELGMSLWDYVSRGWAEKGWAKWYSWAIRSRLKPVKKVAILIKKHLWGIINAIVLEANNGPAEGLNSGIQKLKRRACGFRNRERFRNAIYFHLGGLELYPESARR